MSVVFSEAAMPFASEISAFVDVIFEFTFVISLSIFVISEFTALTSVLTVESSSLTEFKFVCFTEFCASSLSIASCPLWICAWYLLIFVCFDSIFESKEALV